MRSRSSFIICAAALAATAFLWSGCVVVHYEDREGRKFDYSSPAFGIKAIDEVNLQKGTLKGYRSEQSQMAEAIAAGVAAGMQAAATKP